jgi:hypothetical protein
MTLQTVFWEIIAQGYANIMIAWNFLQFAAYSF